MIRCPSCKASEADGTEFELIWMTRVTYAGSTKTVDGGLAYPEDWSEIGFQRFKNAILSCGECKHAWTTTREVVDP